MSEEAAPARSRQRSWFWLIYLGSQAVVWTVGDALGIGLMSWIVGIGVRGGIVFLMIYGVTRALRGGDL